MAAAGIVPARAAARGGNAKRPVPLWSVSNPSGGFVIYTTSIVA